MYIFHKPNYSREKYIDLFIAEKLITKPDSIKYFNDLWDSTNVNKTSAWSSVKKKDRRPVKWNFIKTEFEKLGTISLELTNISGERMYYMSWGSPFSRVRENIIVYKNGKSYLIPFGGFGCGTGIYLEKLKNNETISAKNWNPLLFNPYTNYQLPLKSKKFPKLFKTLYGDSVKIIYEQATYGNPWGKYPSQMIFSQSISVSTDKILQNWENGIHTKNPEFDTDKDDDDGAFEIYNEE